jgi:hypothetical protein
MGSDTGELRSTAAPTTTPDRWQAVVALGDIAVLVLVLLYGELSHGINPVENPVWTAETILPFLVGWAVVAALLGSYDGRTRRLVPSLRTTAVTWLGAANVGLVARGSPFLHGGTTWPFPLVITGFVLLALLAWRSVSVLVVRDRVAPDTE